MVGSAVVQNIFRREAVAVWLTFLPTFSWAFGWAAALGWFLFGRLRLGRFAFGTALIRLRGRCLRFHALGAARGFRHGRFGLRLGRRFIVFRRLRARLGRHRLGFYTRLRRRLAFRPHRRCSRAARRRIGRIAGVGQRIGQHRGARLHRLGRLYGLRRRQSRLHNHGFRLNNRRRHRLRLHFHRSISISRRFGHRLGQRLGFHHHGSRSFAAAAHGDFARRGSIFAAAHHFGQQQRHHRGEQQRAHQAAAVFALNLLVFFQMAPIRVGLGGHNSLFLLRCAHHFGHRVKRTKYDNSIIFPRLR